MKIYINNTYIIMMKKTMMAVFAALLALGVTSCNGDSEDKRILSGIVPAYNLFTPLGGDGKVGVALASYIYSAKSPEAVIALSVTGMALPNGAMATFSTVEMPMRPEIVQIDGNSYEIIGFSAASATQNGVAVKDLKGYLNQAAYPAPELKDYPVLLPGGSSHYIVADYNLSDEWRVRTFWPDMTFRGTTETTYPGMTEAFTTGDIKYRVVMRRDANNGLTGKADIIFYDAKFAPQAPPLSVVLLKDLDLAFTAKGYVVTGKNIAPMTLENGGYTPNKFFTFNEFSMEVSGNLTFAKIGYKVAGKYEGSFQGYSMKW